MLNLVRPILAFGSLALVVSSAAAHFNMLLPQKASVRRGQPVTFVYQWGHPFEHELFDALPPRQILVVSPDRTKTDLTKTLERMSQEGRDHKAVTTYRFRFTPKRRGDFIFALTTAPIWMEADQEFLQDTVKVVLHVQAQIGWDTAVGQGLEMMPLTRPYGLEPGMAFQAQVISGAKPLPGTLVEIERYNPVSPKELPADELITRTAKTDPNGVVTCTLTEPGWWCVTAQQDAGQREHRGKTYPVRQRATLWIWVDQKIVPKKTE